MANVVIVGAQWGDEGKGKVVDNLAQFANAMVRYGGGNNAGHTVVVKGEKTILHLVPSGVLHPGKICILGNGVVVDPGVLLEELDILRKKGIRLTNKTFFISDRAHIIMPYHRRIDTAREKSKKGRIGTTGRGIGPAYEDKMARCGFRFSDLLNPGHFREKLRVILREKNVYLRYVLKEPGFAYREILDAYAEYGRRLKPYVADTSRLIHELIARNKQILFEGAQGTLLDIDHGTYPYVTSSSAGIGGVLTGCGIGPGSVDAIIGVIKAYTTRVGGGPFPTELHDSVGEHLQREGMEYGSTTGRPRRCGWFDAVAGRYSIRINGMTQLALTKLDILTGLDSIKICVGYRIGKKVVSDMPSDLSLLEMAKPVYHSAPGWKEDIRGARSLKELPRKAVEYIRYLEKLMGIPFGFVSVGPQRNQSIIVKNPFETCNSDRGLL
jgi:adenylosuccinate synthase